jgi:hypothetical protein
MSEDIWHFLIREAESVGTELFASIFMCNKIYVSLALRHIQEDRDDNIIED